MDTWKITEEGFHKERIELNGSRFTVGNGCFGCRGTLDEFGDQELAALTLAGVYDDANGWREIVNAPNPLYARLVYQGEELSVLTGNIVHHEQCLDIRHGSLSRKTVFEAQDGNRITFESRRMAGWDERHLLMAEYLLSAERDGELFFETGFDKNIWECNGPHFAVTSYEKTSNKISFYGITGECRKKVTEVCLVDVAEGEYAARETLAHTEVAETESSDKATAGFCFRLKAGKNAVIRKRVYICSGEEHCDETNSNEFVRSWREAEEQKEKIWKTLDITVKGDDEAQLAIRHCQYLLLTAAPFGEKVIAMPARGLSGQVYKGAMFWDTELYMLPMFLYEFPEVAKNLMMYRVRNLRGALDKAREYGYDGAFYPWESQETGQEGCTEYNLTDIFTGRKVRTYFRDKQIHISADVAYGIWKYYEVTQDLSILTEGGARTLLECAGFFVSCAYYKKDKSRFEFLDVTGADEYHERVGNDVYTNGMIKHTMRITLKALELLRTIAEDCTDEASVTAAQKEQALKVYGELTKLPYFEKRIEQIRELEREIYFPEPDANGVLEQFDGFFRLEDCRPEDIQKRIINPNEYLGSPTGLCVETQVSKQADVVLLLTTLPEAFSHDIKKNNYEYYEPRTEHGSSLSTCIYALLAAELGETEKAYRYFMRAACLDLNGDYKLYLGPLYIGGTHPAANGGAWRVLTEGFAGLRIVDGKPEITPRLPAHWEELSFHIRLRGRLYRIRITGKEYCIDEVTEPA